MKILVFSLGPIFKNIVHGGSQKALRDIAVGLAERGHRITILCPQREDNKNEFWLSENVKVVPAIPLKGTFPSPYEVSPYKLYQTCQIIQNMLPLFDVFYLHDGQLNIEYLKNIIPTVISLRDFCYTETLLGALNFEQEKVIVNSDHTYHCLMDSFARINPYLQNNVHLIYNGYNANKFHKKDISKEFMNYIAIPKGNFKFIGFPHRPDLDKGFIESILALERIVQKRRNVKMLIPEYVDKGISDRADNTYSIVNNLLKEKGLEEHIVFHNWIPHYYMDQYYSLCDVVLCIGDFCEAFSNVSVEALLCQVPGVTTNASTYRTMPIKQFLHIVDYKDIEETAKTVIEILDSGDKLKEKMNQAVEFIKLNLNTEKCINEYEKVFLEASKKNLINTRKILTPNYDSKAKFHLAPWCYYIKEEIYNDYEHTTYTDSLDGIFKEAQSLTLKEMESLGLEISRIKCAIENGILLSDTKMNQGEMS